MPPGRSVEAHTKQQRAMPPYTPSTPCDHNFMTLLQQLGDGPIHFEVSGPGRLQLVGAPDLAAEAAAMRAWVEDMGRGERRLREWTQKCMDDQKVSAKGLVQNLVFRERVAPAPSMPLYFRLDTQQAALSNKMLMRLVFSALNPTRRRYNELIGTVKSGTVVGIVTPEDLDTLREVDSDCVPAIDRHHDEIRTVVEKLERIFGSIGKKEARDAGLEAPLLSIVDGEGNVLDEAGLKALSAAILEQLRREHTMEMQRAAERKRKREEGEAAARRAPPRGEVIHVCPLRPGFGFDHKLFVHHIPLCWKCLEDHGDQYNIQVTKRVKARLDQDRQRHNGAEEEEEGKEEEEGSEEEESDEESKEEEESEESEEEEAEEEESDDDDDE